MYNGFTSDLNLFLLVYGFLLFHRPQMREKHWYYLKSLFSSKVTLSDINPSPVHEEPLRVVNAMGCSNGRWRVSDYRNKTIIQPITQTGLDIGFPKKVNESFDSVINRLIKK